MSSSFLEIVEMPNGDIVLQRSDDDAEESRVYLMDGTLEVARAMIQAGIQAAAQMADEGEVEVTEELQEPQPRTLH